jgi:hypothetical protein
MQGGDHALAKDERCFCAAKGWSRPCLSRVQTEKSSLRANVCHRCPTLFVPHVAAYPPGRVHRAVPSDQTTKLPFGRGLIVTRCSNFAYGASISIKRLVP